MDSDGSCYVLDFTGSFPFPERTLTKIAVTILGPHAIVGTKNVFGPGQIVVLGRDEFDKTFLTKTIYLARQRKYRCEYISQEALWRFWVFGDFYPHYPGDPRIRSHPGLLFLASIGFRWPDTYAPPGIGRTVDSASYNSDSELARRFGYNVRRQTTIAQRHSALTAAILDPPTGLGLQHVVYHIASLVRWRKAQLNDRVRNSIICWEADLAWLYTNYYLKSHHSFEWPSLELE